MNILDTEYVIFDVETTGLSVQGGDRMIEIAAVRIKNQTIVDRFESLINPGRDLPIEAQQVNKITPEMIAGAPDREEILPQMLNFIQGACLVAHNIKFDLDFLCYELSLIGRRLKEETPAIDTLKLAKKYLPFLTSYRLENIARNYGLEIGQTHRALADVELTVGVLVKLLKTASKQNVVHFGDLHKQFGVKKPNFKIETVTQEFLF